MTPRRARVEVTTRCYTASALADLMRLGEFLLREDPDEAHAT